MKKLLLFRIIKIPSVFILASIVLIYSGCKKNDTEDANLDPVTNEYDAESIVQHIADGVMNEVLEGLSHDTYGGTEVYGISGSAAVYGDYYYYSGISCGTDCVRSETDIDLAIVFNNYKVMSCDNCESIITGTVFYINNKWSQQNGLSYTSGGSISIAGEDVIYKEVMDGSWGYSDILTFSASGSSEYTISGWCEVKNGNTYYFNK